ncbi:MAG: cation:proton antiporter subunit C [Alphaproteobacteria bacterium]|nr:cation:proton antiporter subunit C [Alphaproteobacteria bacterium]
MDGWIDFVLGRYNYWIAIVLMMTGLYIVYERGNLVKKVVGLNLFQTSVFIFYITIGKIAGGTAPIYIDGELEHGGSEGEAAGEGALHEAPADSANTLGDATPPDITDKIDNATQSLHGKITNDFPANDLKAGLESLKSPADASAGASLHTPPDVDAGKIANDALAAVEKPPALALDLTDTSLHGPDAAANAMGEAAHQVSEVIYTNPLPHVLILTAIVVGVATTAVGLALAVRIREAYGTIEEDELEALDHIAEFGEGPVAGAGTAS